MTYKGRFAPSPSGPLHRGSLVAALGSFLDARANQGQWRLRIEDIDPPREDPLSKTIIPKQLELHGLHWDESVYYQSERSHLYREYLEYLNEREQTYFCNCSRQRIKSIGGEYDGFCRERNNLADNSSVRIRFEQPSETQFAIEWNDLIHGNQYFDEASLGGDFILKRKDGLFSYQLAVAIDDGIGGYTDIIRGEDLLDSTPRQLFIQSRLKISSPAYGHLPLALDRTGIKLSKQNHAPSLDEYRPQENLYFALNILGQNPPIEITDSAVSDIIRWAIDHWQRPCARREK